MSPGRLPRLALLSLAVSSLHYATVTALPPIGLANSSFLSSLTGVIAQPAYNLTALPLQDPYIRRIPHSATLVTFWNHILHPSRDEQLATKIIQQAIRDIIRTERDLDEPMPLVPQIYEYYDEDSIKMYVLSTRDMTWRQWFDALGAIRDFVGLYAHVDSGFFVTEQGDSQILGVGWIGETGVK